MVAPKKEKLKEAEGLLKIQMEALAEKQGELKAVLDRLQLLNDDLDLKKTKLAVILILFGSYYIYVVNVDAKAAFKCGTCDFAFL